MAKIAFSKLKLNKKEDIVNIQINDIEVEVKQYLPINEKLELIGTVMNKAAAANGVNNFFNPVQVDVIGTIEIIKAYTNLSFTEKQQEDIGKLYDILETNGIINMIIAAMPKEEYLSVIKDIESMIEAYYKYSNSVLGILDKINTDYSDLNFDTAQIVKNIQDPESLSLLKDVVTKLG